MYNNMYEDGLSEMFVNYENYVKEAQKEGKNPVSLLKFAFGNF